MTDKESDAYMRGWCAGMVTATILSLSFWVGMFIHRAMT